MRLRALLTHRTTVQRVSSASDNAGGFTDSWSTVDSNVPCRAVSAKASKSADYEALFGNRPGSIDARIVLVQPTVNVQIGDRLVSVTDRRNNVIFLGPLKVDGIGENSGGDSVALITRRIT